MLVGDGVRRPEAAAQLILSLYHARVRAHSGIAVRVDRLVVEDGTRATLGELERL